MTKRLDGKTAIITGAATGIGRASALLFAEEGANAVIADVNKADGQAVADEIISAGGEAFFIHTDLISADSVERMVAETIQKYGKVDILYNNAGVNLFARLTDTQEEDWDRVMAVNVKGVYLCCRYTIPAMKANGGGVIINTASAAAIVGLRNLAAYTASKGAVLQMTKNLALDYAPDNIRVNALCPGVTATEMTLQMIADSPDPQAARERFDSARPMMRMGNPIEIAKAALFLASDESSYMTGAHLVVDGGYTAE